MMCLVVCVVCCHCCMAAGGSAHQHDGVLPEVVGVALHNNNRPCGGSCGGPVVGECLSAGGACVARILQHWQCCAAAVCGIVGGGDQLPDIIRNQ
jgi:hypothetical protein